MSKTAAIKIAIHLNATGNIKNRWISLLGLSVTRAKKKEQPMYFMLSKFVGIPISNKPDTRAVDIDTKTVLNHANKK